jgi:hypothetical protein
MPTMFCQIFQSNGSIAFGIDSDIPGQNLVRRVDFSWQIDNLTAAVEGTLAVPAIALQLYSPKFNPWYTNDIQQWIPRQFQAYRDITMGVTKATAVSGPKCYADQPICTDIDWRGIRFNGTVQMLYSHQPLTWQLGHLILDHFLDWFVSTGRLKCTFNFSVSNKDYLDSAICRNTYHFNRKHNMANAFQSQFYQWSKS